MKQIEPEMMGDDDLAQELDLLESIERYNTQSRQTKRRRRFLAVRAEFHRRFADAM